jgi:hypothetical protein
MVVENPEMTRKETKQQTKATWRACEAELESIDREDQPEKQKLSFW